ncbi:MFS transporter [Dethiothermospora halolimnae]|uniref:MFS transporter n=1 Tax=Dethiothermospora halolimnae TaxID=3114390 RepID=UPI003CCBF4ED
MNNNNIKLTKGLILLMAITSGLTIASTCYNQPLLGLMAKDFNVSRENIGLVATLTQLGYGFGMLFLIPLGDIKERKSLILKVLTLSAIALVLVSVSMNFYWLLVASFLLGFSSIITQLLVPFAASIAKPDRRGKVIGTIISGLITGILSARVVSGFVGPRLGWRAVYIISIFLITILTLTLKRFLPTSKANSKDRYIDIMKSLVGIIKNNPVVRSSSIIGPCIFASFQLFWTSIVFYLDSPVYNLGSEVAGLFSLVGIVGVFLVPYMGTLSDKKSPRFAIGVSATLAFMSFVILYLFGSYLIGLIIGVTILDFSVNSSQVSNQARINAIDSPARNRFNSIFMSCYFFVGSLGSFLGSYSYNKHGWTGVCVAGFILVSIAIITHFTLGRQRYKGV